MSSKHKKRERPNKIYDRVKERTGNQIIMTQKFFQSCACNYERKLIGTNVLPGWDGNYEYIKYKIHNKKPYTTVLPCLHVKNAVTWIPTPSNVCVCNNKINCYGSWVPRDIWDYESSNGFGYPFAFGSRLPGIPDVSLGHREALAFFAAACQPLETNLAVNLTEISEMFAMAIKVFKAIKLLKEVFITGQPPISWKSYLRRLKEGNTKFEWDTTGKLSEAYLAYSFVVAPFIADVKSTIDVLTNLGDRIKWLIENNKKPVPVRFQKDYSSFVPTETVKFPTTNGYFNKQFVTAYKATYKAFALATYDVSGLSESQVRYKLLKKATGFCDPISFLWEKIPFSFVLDWITNVGDYLATFDKPVLFPYVLAMSGWSLNVESTVEYAIQWYNDVFTPPEAYKGVFAVDKRSYYIRQPEIPVTYSGLDLSPPTIKQLSLALALGRSFFH